MYTANGWVNRLAMANDDPGVFFLLIAQMIPQGASTSQEGRSNTSSRAAPAVVTVPSGHATSERP